MPAAANISVHHGCVDFLTPCRALHGWLASGWIASSWPDHSETLRVTLTFLDGSETSDGALCLFSRADVASMGSGFVLFVAGAPEQRSLQHVILHSSTQDFTLHAAHDLSTPPEAEAIIRCRGQLASAPRGTRKQALLRLLNRPVAGDADTVCDLSVPAYIEVDLAVFCPPHGVYLCGWTADPFQRIASMRLVGGMATYALDSRTMVTFPRPDLTQSVSGVDAADTARAGFMAYAPQVSHGGAAPHIEIETVDGELAFRRLPPLRPPGLDSVRDILNLFDLRRRAMSQVFDRAVGPALTAIAARLHDGRRAHYVLPFGASPARASCSVIVPLYGRIDFMEYQLSHFSRSLPEDTDLIYVLDDPLLCGAAEALAESCFARFAFPFRLIMQEQNAGFAAASNLGLRYATAPAVCFLNSDIVPQRADWLTRMLGTLHGTPGCGAVGALLLYEDGTIQHDGCQFAPLPEFDDWIFCLHPAKGRLPCADESVRTVPAVTGACLMMRTALARDLGGFDEAFLVGDFEDADLCRRITARGLRCVVDRGARLYHFERQSQGGQTSPWRLNLTLFNAWIFRRKWPVSAERLRRGRNEAA